MGKVYILLSFLWITLVFLGDRMQNISPYAIGPLAVCLSVCLSVCL